MSSENELLACPFCGGQARVHEPDMASPHWQDVYVECTACEATGESSPFNAFDTEDPPWSVVAGAIAAWNRRAEPAPSSPVPAEAVETIARAIATADGKNPDAMSHNSFHWWRHYVPHARACLAVCPAGWKLVPIEPTPEMVEASIAEMQAQSIAFDEFSPPIYPAKVYRAMLSAAPAHREVGE